MDIVAVGRGLLGVAVLTGVCWLLSADRRRVNWRLVAGGLVLQLALALLLLKVPLANDAVRAVAGFFVKLLDFSAQGSAVVFGKLAEDPSIGAFFAFRVLPSVVFFSALMSILYYLGVLQRLVWAIAWVMQKTMRLSGAESLAAAANVFVGQTEAPLVIRPYVEKMTQSELLALMTGGMATIAGGVMALYITWLGGDDPARQAYYGMHLLTASIMSAPAALMCAKLLLPETGEVDHHLKVSQETFGVNVFDAAVRGTSDGLTLALNVGAVLLVFTGLIALGNHLTADLAGEALGLNPLIREWTGGAHRGLTLEFMAGVLFAPAAWLLGVGWENCLAVGQLLGVKTVANELIAYDQLRNMLYGTAAAAPNAALAAAPRDVLIATYALCGFANFASMGIQIGGIAVIAPGRRADLARLAPKALLAGTIACFLTAALAGFLA